MEQPGKQVIDVDQVFYSIELTMEITLVVMDGSLFAPAVPR
jgi:hypothetical protein